MFTIDVSLKGTPVTLTVQQKSQADAEALYHKILAALHSGSNEVLELTCEQQPGKKVSVLANQIAAVQIFEKTSTSAASGRPPGFAFAE